MKKLEKKYIEANTTKKKGELVAIASTNSEDRVGDSLKMSDWCLKDYLKNPVLQAGHEHAPQFTIGIAKNLKIDSKKLTFTPCFHEHTQLARDIKAMYESDPPILKAWSVGFLPKALMKDEVGEPLGKNELLEVSAVAVPANAECLTEAKSYDKSVVKKVEDWVTKQVNVKDLEESVVEKPYENEHACRLQDPGKYKKFRRGSRVSKNGKKYSIIFGITSAKKSEEQSYRYDKKVWSESEAKKHCATRKGSSFHPAKKSEKEEKYVCECLDCDYILKTSEHCKNVECPKCGGKMRRVERPGSGQKNYQERWNKQLPEIFNSKDFDISSETSKVTTFEYRLYTGYLDCEVRHLNLNNFLIPSPWLGSYLAGFKEILGDYKVIDERNFTYYGTEEPIDYEVIKLNSKEEDDFLVKGTRFYKSNKSDRKFIVKFEPCFYGLQAQIITRREDREWNKDLLLKVKKWVKENNKLKGEAFCLSGEFIDRMDIKWEDVILPKVIKGAVMKGANQLNKNGKDSVSRGMMFIGKPGTGKTLSGKAMMSNLKDKTFIWVSARDFEKLNYKMTLTLAFDLARQLNPVVLFMEDIDSWLKEGTMMDLLKTELDGLQENKGLITVLTSNNPEEFPDALLDRPGRFHDVLEFSLPNKELRERMIKEWSGIKDFTDEELKKLIHYTKEFSGAHMRELIDFAKMIASDDKVDLKKALFESLDKLIEQRELVERIKKNRKNKEDQREDKGIKLKEGRVLSTKNRNLIKKCVLTTKDTTVALEKLVNVTEPPIKEDSINTPEKVEGNSNKGREPKKVKAQVNVELRILQKIAGLSNRGIQKLRNNDK